jgi:hypothetical protein
MEKVKATLLKYKGKQEIKERIKRKKSERDRMKVRHRESENKHRVKLSLISVNLTKKSKVLFQLFHDSLENLGFRTFKDIQRGHSWLV